MRGCQTTVRASNSLSRTGSGERRGDGTQDRLGGHVGHLRQAARAARGEVVLEAVDPHEQAAARPHAPRDRVEGRLRRVGVVDHALGVDEVEGALGEGRVEQGGHHEVDARPLPILGAALQQCEVEVHAPDLLRPGRLLEGDRLSAHSAAHVKHGAWALLVTQVAEPGQPDAPVQLHEVLAGVHEGQLVLLHGVPLGRERLLDGRLALARLALRQPEALKLAELVAWRRANSS